MAKGKYYTPEFKEQAVKMVIGLHCTYDLLHASQGQCFRLDAHPDRSRSARPRRGQTPGMTAAGSRPSRNGAHRRTGLPHPRVPPRARGRPARPTSGAAADQSPQHRARPCHSIESPADSRKDLPQISLTLLATRRYSSRPLNFAANSPGITSDRRSF